MKIAVFGASGRTGIPLVQQALAAGHEVRALVRTPSKMTIQHERLTLIQGDIMDAACVAQTIAGTEAVINVIGHVKGSPDNLQTQATENIMAAMKQHRIRRLISLTGAGVRAPEDQPKLLDKFAGFMLKLLSPKVINDGERFTQLIRNSDLDWIIVRGPVLTEGPHTGKYKVGFVGKDSGFKISRADVADFMLKLLQDNRYLKQLPVVTT
ncbi:MAG: SDR family oxidoreductase [Anaerolineae bacterium]|jgi:putative NADH-flavin reductase|nr:SDR family oxidoreductase [Anaerolineae bacterium]